MSQFLWLLPTAFWIWMMADCLLYEPDRNRWIWLLVVLNAPGAVVYFLVCKAPRMRIPIPSYFGRWTRQQELRNAEAMARNLRNAHQYGLLGNLLWELQWLERADQAYQWALEKEPHNTQALWGAAGVAIHQKDYAKARPYLEKLLGTDPDYKFGDGILAYGRTLLALQDWQAARLFLEKIPIQAAHPEVNWMLGRVLEQLGDPGAALPQYQAVVDKVHSAPTFSYRRNRSLLAKAQRRLRELSR